MKKVLNFLGIILLVVVVMFGIVIGEEYARGYFFYLSRLHGEHAPLSLTPTALSKNSVTKPIGEWLQDSRVTMDNTMILVSRDYPLPDGYEADLVEYNGAKMHPLMVEPYIALRDAVQEKTGVRIYVSSDFRTAEKQASLLEFYGPDRAAPVGCSEHEAGLSLDVYAPAHASYDFLRSPAGREVNRICAEYGYIIRYDADMKEITKIDYEPWHLRYVGAPHARLITDSGLAYEEYIQAIRPETWYAYENYLILRTAIIEELTLPTSFASCHISPDNTGYYVVTVEL